MFSLLSISESIFFSLFTSTDWNIFSSLCFYISYSNMEGYYRLPYIDYVWAYRMFYFAVGTWAPVEVILTPKTSVRWKSAGYVFPLNKYKLYNCFQDSFSLVLFVNFWLLPLLLCRWYTSEYIQTYLSKQ